MKGEDTGNSKFDKDKAELTDGVAIKNSGNQPAWERRLILEEWV